MTELIPLIVFVAIGAVFYLAGAPTRRDRGTVALAAAQGEAAPDE